MQRSSDATAADQARSAKRSLTFPSVSIGKYIFSSEKLRHVNMRSCNDRSGDRVVAYICDQYCAEVHWSKVTGTKRYKMTEQVQAVMQRSSDATAADQARSAKRSLTFPSVSIGKYIFSSEKLRHVNMRSCNDRSGDRVVAYICDQYCAEVHWSKVTGTKRYKMTEQVQAIMQRSSDATAADQARSAKRSLTFPSVSIGKYIFSSEKLRHVNMRSCNDRSGDRVVAYICDQYCAEVHWSKVTGTKRYKMTEQVQAVMQRSSDATAADQARSAKRSLTFPSVSIGKYIFSSEKLRHVNMRSCNDRSGDRVVAYICDQYCAEVHWSKVTGTKRYKMTEQVQAVMQHSSDATAADQARSAKRSLTFPSVSIGKYIFSSEKLRHINMRSCNDRSGNRVVAYICDQYCAEVHWSKVTGTKRYKMTEQVQARWPAVMQRSSDATAADQARSAKRSLTFPSVSIGKYIFSSEKLRHINMRSCNDRSGDRVVAYICDQYCAEVHWSKVTGTKRYKMTEQVQARWPAIMQRSSDATAADQARSAKRSLTFPSVSIGKYIFSSEKLRHVNMRSCNDRSGDRVVAYICDQYCAEVHWSKVTGTKRYKMTEQVQAADQARSAKRSLTFPSVSIGKYIFSSEKLRHINMRSCNDRSGDRVVAYICDQYCAEVHWSKVTGTKRYKMTEQVQERMLTWRSFSLEKMYFPMETDGKVRLLFADLAWSAAVASLERCMTALHDRGKF
ncbi:hypothetical protein PHYSODRAFT_330640 [Phytophthora sojae]|uniref:Uncharacterized protein n=1 Tax=Phytophthora sojae (strain P6497) TaxID=1094619 RepID=G4ZF71_PHYSP|nr:hypothetical protein PHYSODRAFT_330640 [Phytophthora sojae]EGZ16574.1 hypothetical protein PHYSODRAFT_330640 [Phytophthora sojae]|eukprot:XP_009525632.1 hypothetical protein PHYSODRAFT_330640 [Phytophthora sojae]